jgi:hypothetical protein
MEPSAESSPSSAGEYAEPQDSVPRRRAPSVDGPSLKEELVLELREYEVRAADTFVKLSPSQRFRLTSFDTQVAQFVCLVGFVTWASTLPFKHAAATFSVSPAYAQTGGPPAVLDPRPYIQIAIFAALFGIFLLSIWVNYFGKNPDSAERADTVAKALLGFFIGASSNYLGLTLKG